MCVSAGETFDSPDEKFQKERLSAVGQKFAGQSVPVGVRSTVLGVRCWLAKFISYSELELLQ